MVNKFSITVTAFVMHLFCSAQTFNYNLAQTNSSYSAISGDTIKGDSLTQELSTAQLYSISLDFSFSFLGSSFDSVKISPNGYLTFNNGNNYCISVFESLFTLIDSAHSSSIIYSTTGSFGNKICKIQFTDFSFGMSAPGEHISFQLWLYQNNNKIEIHTGPLNANLDPNPLRPALGLINKQQNTSPWAYMLNGDAATAQASSLTGTENVYMNDLPVEGTVYTFSVVE